MFLAHIGVTKMEQSQSTPPSKKGVIINLMFSVSNDKEALDIKQLIDNAIVAIKEKRYTFQIVES